MYLDTSTYNLINNVETRIIDAIMYRCVGQKGSVAMLIIKKLAGVAPESEESLAYEQQRTQVNNPLWL